MIFRLKKKKRTMFDLLELYVNRIGIEGDDELHVTLERFHGCLYLY